MKSGPGLPRGDGTRKHDRICETQYIAIGTDTSSTVGKYLLLTTKKVIEVIENARIL